MIDKEELLKEKELIDYASDRLFNVLTKSNPFTINATDRISADLSNALTQSMRNLSIQINQTLIESSKAFLEQQRQLSEQTERATSQRHKQTLRVTIVIATVVTLVVNLGVEWIKREYF